MSVVTLFVVTLPVVESVTCRICHDQLEGCTGGENCPLSKTTKENMAALAVGAVASASLVATKLFPGKPFVEDGLVKAGGRVKVPEKPSCADSLNVGLPREYAQS